MKKETLIKITVCFLVLQSNCNAQTSKAPTEGEISVPIAAKTLKDPTIWLNGEAMGTTDDPSGLRAKLREIITRREQDGNYIEPDASANKDLESLQAPRLRDGIYLVVAPEVSIGDFRKVYLLLDEIGTVFIPRADAIKTVAHEPRPNPLLLAVSVGGAEADLSDIGYFPDIDVEETHSYSVYVYRYGDEDDIWYTRIVGAIEILADGSYIINEPYKKIDGKKTVDDYPPKQRRTRAELSDEIAQLMFPLDMGKNSLKVVASRSAPYKSLDEILKLAGKMNLHFEIQISQVQ